MICNNFCVLIRICTTCSILFFVVFFFKPSFFLTCPVFPQTTKSLQRKLEEKEEALLGRTRVVEMLQQEINNSDLEKQVL